MGASWNKRGLHFGVGINDYPDSICAGGVKLKSYQIWRNVLERCYGESRDVPAYRGCTMCKEWRRFSVFKNWFDLNYKKGYHLDKDLLSRGNREYSPEKCCFVPQEVNKLILNRANSRGRNVIGVHLIKRSGRYNARLNIRGNRVFLGNFETEKQAFLAYKEAKEKHIKEVAQAYFNDGRITERVYNAMLQYKISITD